MSVRGPRGGRGRGRGTGRGRGRGRGKTVIWEWESYTPGPEVFDELWHIRNAPATVTPYLPTECPIQHAQTRITDRRQTEGDIQRNFYVVEVTNFDPRDSSVSSAEDAPLSSTEIVHVDLSRILEYVSPDELERYENEQFKIEAEAEAIAMRVEAEEVAQRRLEKNARVPGAGKGSRMLSGLGLDAEARRSGRPRGRGRGRGRGSWRGRGALVLSGQLRDDVQEEELVDVEPDEALHREDEDVQLLIAETDSEEDSEAPSPNLARSAFVANSALPVSPVAPHRRPSGLPIIRRTQFEDADEDSDFQMVDADARSMSSAAMQLRIEDDIRRRSDTVSDSANSQHDRHRSKRQRTESTASNQRRPIAQPRQTHSHNSFYEPIAELSSDAGSGPDESITVRRPAPVYRSLQPQNTNGSSARAPSQPPPEEQQSEDEDEDGDEDADEDAEAEEYIVEAIIEHYRDAGKKYYLVKWQGYEDSFDWLPEEDLEGAAELIAEYIERVRRRKMGK